MDRSALVAVAALNANLKRSRFHKLSAQIHSNGTHAGGVVQVETMVQLGKGFNTDEWICGISVKVHGLPKGTPDKGAEDVTPIFSVKAEIKGVYAWVELPAKEVLTDPSLANALGRPLYTIAAAECRAAAAKMGFFGISIAPDLPRASEGDVTPGDEDDMRRLDAVIAEANAQKKVRKKATAKRVSSPRTKV